jgi:lysozyme
MQPGKSGLLGIDVSSNQGPIDWEAVSKAKFSFAFLRATIGAHTSDQMFAFNWMAIRGSGLVRGAYHYFWPLTSAAEQADKYIAAVGALVPGDLPPAIDLEEAYLKKDTNHDHEFWKTIPRDERLPMILGWLSRVESALGRKPIIYSRDNFLENLLGENVLELAPYALWIAHYTDAPQPRIPSAWRNWTFWQYTEEGAVGGVSGKVDLDRFNGTRDDLKSFGLG